VPSPTAAALLVAAGTQQSPLPARPEPYSLPQCHPPSTCALDHLRYRAESGVKAICGRPHPRSSPFFPLLKCGMKTLPKARESWIHVHVMNGFVTRLRRPRFTVQLTRRPSTSDLHPTEATRVGICKARNGRRQSQHSRRADNRAHPTRRQWSTCMRPPRWQLSQPILALASHWRSQHRCSAHRMGNRCICTTRTVTGERRATPLTAAHGCRAALNAGVCSAVACAPRCP
jgi:hypothetical protein